MSPGYELEVVAVVAGLMYAQPGEVFVNHTTFREFLADRALIIVQRCFAVTPVRGVAYQSAFVATYLMDSNSLTRLMAIDVQQTIIFLQINQYHMASID